MTDPIQLGDPIDVRIAPGHVDLKRAVTSSGAIALIDQNDPMVGFVVGIQDQQTVHVVAWDHHGKPHRFNELPVIRGNPATGGEAPPAVGFYGELPAERRAAFLDAMRRQTAGAERWTPRTPGTQNGGW